MTMILTIFGYAKTGKTTLFNLLTSQKESTGKFSTSAHEFHKATVDVPDDRLSQLAQFCQLPPVAAKIEYLDSGAIAYGDVKNTTFIDLLRRADGLIHMVRGFHDEEILHPAGTIDPARDRKNMEEELITTDYIGVEKRIEKLVLEMKKVKSKEFAEEHELMLRIKAFLEEMKPLRQFQFTPHEENIIRGFKFLSQKPLLHVINTDENNYKEHSRLRNPAEDKKAIIVFCGRIEHELLELNDEDRLVFQQEYGLQDYEYVKTTFVRSSYELMNLISYFTVGKDEVHSWTVQRGDNAFIAAGKIHSDIQQGFIRAEVINWQDFIHNGGFSGAKDKGVLKLEGKDYIVQDGEVIHFRFNK